MYESAAELEREAVSEAIIAYEDLKPYTVCVSVYDFQKRLQTR